MGEHILVVDDEPNFLRLLFATLSEEGYVVSTTTNANDVIPLIEKEVIDLIITDLSMPELGGIELMENLQSLYPGLPIIIITGVGTIEIAVEAIKKGAYDFITKPFELEKVSMSVKKALEYKALCNELKNLRKEVQGKYQFNMIGQSKIMMHMFSLIEQVADTDSTIIIRGESGTGKEVLAKAIHYLSARKNKSFMPIDCGSLSETLLESELFGHVKGAFTGAYKARAGLFESSEGGTIFLDEIQNIPLNTQAKLLRVLQEREVKPVGSDKINKIIDIRLIASTQKDLSKLIHEGKFREDLYYRLKIFEVEIPPLRKRRDDIPLLISHFIKMNNTKLGKQIQGVEAAALEILCSFDYPGNVRELQNIIERAMILCRGNYIGINDLPKEIGNRKQLIKITTNMDELFVVPKNNDELKAAKSKARKIAEEKVELLFLNYLLPLVDGSIKKAAEHAKMNRSWLSQLIGKYEIDLSQFHN